MCPNGAPLFKWELQAKVDDGTGQAMVWADGGQSFTRIACMTTAIKSISKEHVARTGSQS